MSPLIPIPVIAVTVTLLIWAALRGDDKQVYLWKPLSTLLVILVALLSFTTPGVKPAYTWGVTLGLVLSLGGDVALMFKANRWFMIGLVSFLLAQIVYSIVFTVPNGFHLQDLVTAAVLLVLAALIYLYLKPGLGKMQGPVIFYILAICFMVNRAVSTFFGTFFSTTQAWLIAVGAILFWVSDLLLAINRFRRPFRLERLGLYLYYGGQLLIALSPSYFV
ncbi:MAG: lysoplasmalogenase [Anaerolineae bacterium]|nr:lysoplasmalogenase [Anaerolineae bacterium]